MTCPACHSFELDGTGLCGVNGGCGYQVSVADEQRLKAAMPAPRTRRYQEDLEDFALREA